MIKSRLSPALLALLCLATSVDDARGQDASSAVEGFAGLRWGATEEEVKDAMRKKRGIRDGKMLPARMEFLGGSFAQISAERWVLAFENGGLASGLVRLEPGLLRIAELHKKVCDQLVAKYGAPEFARNGPRHQFARWIVPLPEQRRGRIRIICEALIPQNRVHLRYINDALEGNRPEEFWE